MRQQAITKRILLQLRRDKRTIALIFFAPLMLLTLMYFLFQQSSDTTATVGYNQSVSAPVVKQLKKAKHVKYVEYHDQQTPKKHIQNADLTGFIKQDGHKLIVTYQNADQSKTAVLKQTIQGVMGKLQAQQLTSALAKQVRANEKIMTTMAQSSQIPAQKKPTETGESAKVKYSSQAKYIYSNGSATFFTTMLPVLMGFIVFFFVFLITGMSLLGERSSGTLERVLATPIKRWEVIAGYIQGYGLFAVVQTLLILSYTIIVLKIEILGALWLVGLTDILIALVALSLGLFVSTFAASEFQMVQFIPLLVLPQIFFAGIVPVENMAGWLQAIAHVMPLYYGANALSAVIAKGATFSDVWVNLSVLFGFFILLTGLNILGLKRYRKV
ncbi:ABC transporter permease [Periweissella cryptocerci]|uniref:ABC transporter permease n=1 Tax=Periweissella cryptocerci TaxID=2506420 RepID=A0A4P6YRA2_9LACO|nr:ABC transporter permease [Periweissella cryptocerci]QBO35169.1 ABC transporter permease [Periweissella cryptocerci]